MASLDIRQWVENELASPKVRCDLYMAVDSGDSSHFILKMKMLRESRKDRSFVVRSYYGRNFYEPLKSKSLAAPLSDTSLSISWYG